MREFVSQYPEVIGVIVVIAGFLTAHLVSKWSIAGLAFTTRLYKRLSPDSEPLTTQSQLIISKAAYYVTLFLFLLVAIRSLGIDGLGSSLDELIAYIPRILVGLVFIFGGYIVGVLARELIAKLMNTDSNRPLPVATQYIVIVIAAVTGLEQIEVELTFLATLTTVLFATVIGGLSLAFALGSKDLVSNMLMRRELDRYAIGDYIQVGDIRGQVIELTRTSIVLASDNGNIVIPASLLANSMVTHTTEPPADE